MIGFILGAVLLGQTTVIIQPQNVAICTLPQSGDSLAFSYNYDAGGVLRSVDVTDTVTGDTTNCSTVQQVNVQTVSAPQPAPVQVPPTMTPVPTSTAVQAVETDTPVPLPTPTATPAV